VGWEDRLVQIEHTLTDYLFGYSFDRSGNSGIFQYASGGSLEDAIWYSEEVEWNSTENLVIAYQAASG
jgi:hypothetical protein